MKWRNTGGGGRKAEESPPAVKNANNDLQLEDAFFDLSYASVSTTYAQQLLFFWRNVSPLVAELKHKVEVKQVEA